MSWPHSHIEEATKASGTAFVRGDVLGDYDQIFVRCYDCHGDGCESCGGTGFDWADTVDVRATMRVVTGEESPMTSPPPDEAQTVGGDQEMVENAARIIAADTSEQRRVRDLAQNVLDCLATIAEQAREIAGWRRLSITQQEVIVEQKADLATISSRDQQIAEQAREIERLEEDRKMWQVSSDEYARDLREAERLRDHWKREVEHQDWLDKMTADEASLIEAWQYAERAEAQLATLREQNEQREAALRVARGLVTAALRYDGHLADCPQDGPCEALCADFRALVLATPTPEEEKR